MSHFILDEEASEAITFDFRGETFTVGEVPARFWTKGMQTDLDGALAELLGDDAERFWALRPTMTQVESLIEHIAAEVGASVGKSASPSRSSAGTPTPSTWISAVSGG